MKITNILVSQPAPSSLLKSPYNELINKHSLGIDFISLIKIEGASVKEFRSQRIDVLGHSAIIFTSRTAIDNFFRVCEEARIVMPEMMKYFCVTEAVALYLQKYIVYRKRKIFFGKGPLTDLAEVIVKHNEETFLLPLVEPHKLDVPQALDKLKIKYSKLIIAHTVSADLSAIDFKKYNMLVFYSPSDIEAFLSAAPKFDEDPLIATFGNGTAVSAVNAGLTVSVIAPTPQSPSMTTALDNFIHKYNAGMKIDSVKVEKLDDMASIIKIAQPKIVKATKKKTVRSTVKSTDLNPKAKIAVKDHLAKSSTGKSAAKSVLAKRAK